MLEKQIINLRGDNFGGPQKIEKYPQVWFEKIYCKIKEILE